MKKRWMKSVVKASKAEVPMLPFNRVKRYAGQAASAPVVLELKRKTA